jgi:hypothetical protein
MHFMYGIIVYSHYWVSACLRDLKVLTKVHCCITVFVILQQGTGTVKLFGILIYVEMLFVKYKKLCSMLLYVRAKEKLIWMSGLLLW